MNSVSIFISFAPEDKELLEQLEQHLAPLKRQGLVSIWNHRDISAGTKWEEEIHHYLNTAQIILLLISANFINSDYHFSNEMQQAMERHKLGETRVIPIILRPVDWAGLAFATLSMLPENAKPVVTWDNREEAFLDIAKSIRKIIKSEDIKTLEDTNIAPNLFLKRAGTSVSFHRTFVKLFYVILVLFVGIVGGGIWSFAAHQNQGNTQNRGNLQNTAQVQSSTITPYSYSPTTTQTAAIKPNSVTTPVTSLATTQTTTTTQNYTITPTAPPATPRPLSPPSILLTAEVGSVYYQDTLTDSSNSNTQSANWDGIDGKDPNCTFSSDGYHIVTGVGIPQFCHERNNIYQNAFISVDMVIVSGISAGLLFRDQFPYPNTSGAYFFEIGTDGRYKISSATTAQPLQDWTYASAIHTAKNAVNTLQIETQGSSFLFYINGSYLVQITDGSYAQGSISFACYANTTTSGKAIFRNLKIQH